MLYLFVLIVSTNIYAQKTTGIVIDSLSKQPLKKASISIDGSSILAFTNSKGEFQLTTSNQSSIVITIKRAGYHTENISISIPQSKLLVIELCPDEVHLDGYTIHGKHDDCAGQSKIELNLPEIDRLKGQTLGDIIKHIPGVSMINSGAGISKPVLRGLTGSRVITVYNQIRQEGQQWGIEHAPEIDPLSIGSIEILKGVGGIEYGADALGGVIKINPISYRPYNGKEATIYSDINSNNKLYGGGLVLNSHLNKKSWRVIASYKRAGDSKTPQYILSNTGYQNISFQTGYKYVTNNYFMEFNYSIYYAKNAMLKASHFGNISDLLKAIASDTPLYIKPFTYKISKPYQDVLHQTASIKWNTILKNGSKLTLQHASQYNQRNEFDADIVYNQNISKQNLAAFSLGIYTGSLDAKWNLQYKKYWKISIGFSYMYQNNLAWGKRYLLPNFNGHLAGVYASSTYRKKNNALEFGIRGDARYIKSNAVRNFVILNETKKYNGITSIFSYAKELTKSIELGYTSATGWRAPNVSELYSNGLHGATGNFEIGNSNLKKEVSWNNEITLKVQRKKINLETNIYFNQFKNYIYMQPEKEPTLTIHGAFPTMKYYSGTVDMAGAEIKCMYIPSSNWQLELLSSYINAKNTDLKQPLWLMPTNKIKTSYIYIPKKQKVLKEKRVEIDCIYTFKQNHYQPNLDYALPPSAYTILRLKFETFIQVKKQTIKINLTINNVLNKSYRDYLYRFRYYADEQGRDVQLKIQVPINTIPKHIHNN